MNEMRRVILKGIGWTGLITGAHFFLNVDGSELLNDRLPKDQRKLYAAYIPVT
jgi:hypothetical protein